MDGTGVVGNGRQCCLSKNALVGIFGRVSISRRAKLNPFTKKKKGRKARERGGPSQFFFSSKYEKHLPWYPYVYIPGIP